MLELNKAQLVGRLTKDPETRTLNSGAVVCEMRLASDRSWMNKNTGEREKETLFITVKAWAKLAEFCQQYMRKGSGVYVEGRLVLETWKDKSTGQERERISILAEAVRWAESKADVERRGGSVPDGQSAQAQTAKPAPAQTYAAEANATGSPHSDLPF